MKRNTLTTKPWSFSLFLESVTLHKRGASKEEWKEWSKKVKLFQNNT